jgi:hypothetical protein
MVREQPVYCLIKSWKKPKIVEGKDWKIEPNRGARRDSTVEFDILWKHVPSYKNENHILGEGWNHLWPNKKGIQKEL